MIYEFIIRNLYKKGDQKSGHLFVRFKADSVDGSTMCECTDIDVVDLSFVFNFKAIFIDGVVEVLTPSFGRMLLIHFEWFISAESSEIDDFTIGNGVISSSKSFVYYCELTGLLAYSYSEIIIFFILYFV